MLRLIMLTAVLGGIVANSASNLQAQTRSANLATRGMAHANISTTRYLANRPTVSPYLNLIVDQQNRGLSTYHTLVRPQLEQRRQAQEQQVAIQRLNSQLSGVRSQLRRNTVPGQPTATGHMTRFMTHSHYYPGLLMR